MRAETEGRAPSFNDVIVQVQPKQPQKASESACCVNIRLAGFTLRRGVAMSQQDDPTRGSEYARNDMGKIDRQRMMVADQFQSLNQAAGRIVQVERTQFTAAGLQITARVSSGMWSREKGMAHRAKSLNGQRKTQQAIPLRFCC